MFAPSARGPADFMTGWALTWKCLVACLNQNTSFRLWRRRAPHLLQLTRPFLPFQGMQHTNHAVADAGRRSRPAEINAKPCK
jgi:hypothetical protein